jgi:hypothetical protein
MHDARKWTAALSLGLLTACGIASGAPEETATRSGSLNRDLKLQSAAAPAVEIASPVELGRAEPEQRAAPRPRSSPRPAPAPSPDRTPDAAPAPELVSAPAPVSVATAPAPAAPAPAADSRELAPGQTVTVLPASSGTTSSGADTYVPGDSDHGAFKPGGHCPLPPRRGGRPIGIVGFR